MAINSLTKRIEKLEQKTGQNMPEVKMFFIEECNYLEKDKEIRQAEKDGNSVFVVSFIPAKNGEPDPEYIQYYDYLEQRKVKQHVSE